LSSDSVDVVYGGPAMHSAQRCFWSVRVWDNHGHVSGWAPAAWWEMGLLGASDWTGARWIMGAASQSAPLLRTGLTLSKPIAQARLYISAGGYYLASINGQRVGNVVLDPGFTAYHKRILYSTYDVTDRLHQGANALGVMLGRGFYSIDTSRQILWWDHAPWLSRAPILFAKLDVTYSDQTHAIVVSGTDWNTHSGPSTSDSIYRGETYDARLAMIGWDTPGYDAGSWASAQAATAPAGNLQAQMAEPMRVVNTFKATSITQPKPGVYVYKFPIMLAGWARLTVSGAAGTTVVLRLGEALNKDGTVNNAGDPGITPGEIQKYEYTLSGSGTETWEPQFSYAGFQFVQVDGFPGTPTANSVVAREVHSDVPTIGSFSSSNPLLNEIHELCKRAVLNNLHSIPTDTPAYEKRGWGGDALLYSAQAVDNFGMQRFFTKWMYDLADSQDKNNDIADIAPGLSEAMEPSWSSAFVGIPWRLYLEYGDRGVLSTHYDPMKRYVDFLSSKATNHLIAGFYGDWVSPGFVHPPEGPDLLASANYYRDALLLSKMAGVVGRPDDEATYSKLAAAIKESFNSTYLDAAAGVYRTNKLAGYRQTSSAVPLEFGMVPPEQAAAVFSNLVADVQHRDNHLNTGAFGTAALLPALTKDGQVNLAYAIAAQKSYPSWGYWVSQGATSAIEVWEYAEARSHDHAFLGSVDDWFFKYLAGIQPAAPGYNEIDIRPYLPSGLDSASGSIQTPLGLISSSWTRGTGDAVVFKVVIPANATANVWVPGRNSPVRAGSGSYTYHGVAPRDMQSGK
jgi:alpha-L-rhamnosidase